MEASTLQKVAGIAAWVVGLTSLGFGLLFLFALPDAQKGPAPAALTSFANNPLPVEAAFVLVIVGALAALVAVIGIFRLLHASAGDWALLGLIVGCAFTLLTALDATYTAFLFPSLSTAYLAGDAALKASAILAWNAPSPINPFDFTEFCLSGLWLLLTGVLMVRTVAFNRLVGYLALLAGIGQLALFVSTFLGVMPLIVGIGVPGAVVIGPLFWLVVGATLWRRAQKSQIELMA